MSDTVSRPPVHLDLRSRSQALLGRLPGEGLLTERVSSLDGVTILLLAMEKGAVLKEHAANGILVLHLLRGEIRFVVAGEPLPVIAGDAVMVPAGVQHAVEAHAQSVAVLTISETGHE